jgi:pyruvate dehydrogenase E2 component (dihydrolipoamide acetyltransferase)
LKMATVVEMPKLSDTMEEGAVAKWLKKEGEIVDEGGPICEIETDKATMEYQSPAGGVLVKILVQPGKTIALNTPIAVVAKKGEQVDLDALLKDFGPAKSSSPAAKASPLPPPAAAKPAPAARSSSATASASAAAPAAVAPVQAGRIKSSPLARRVAADRGIDLGRVSGSGPGGRVVLRDLDQVPEQGRPAGLNSGVDTQIPVSMMRKTIAKRLLAGKNDAPHFYLTVSANMKRMNDWRTQLNKAASDNQPKVSVNDLVILAVSRALRQHPVVNSSWQGETILQYGNVHVAMAVALPTGLVTPVIRHTDQLGIRQIAAASRDLANRAKAGQLGNDDYSGGTFTISNLGMFGIEEFTAIINPPQAAILAVGATIPTPSVDSNGQIVVEQRMKMTLSCDHRVVDGASGAQFLQTLVNLLEDPLMMLA